MTTRALFGLAAGLLLPAWASAQDCDTCGPRLGNSFSLFNRGCNLRPYPQLETQYIKQFCGPHVSPESCFGYFKPRVTPWGQACPNYRCDELAATAVAMTPVATPAPVAKPVRETPPPIPQVPPPKSEPAPMPKSGGLPATPGLSSQRMPDLPPVAEPDYGPPPIPAIPTAPVVVRHY